MGYVIAAERMDKNFKNFKNFCRERPPNCVSVIEGDSKRLTRTINTSDKDTRS
jgi:hypothetical protein